MASIWSKILYKFFGPTTVHLQNEFVLLAILSLFTSASFCTMYHSNEFLLTSSPALKDHGCRRKETIYIILSTAWLGRHLIQRIICTTEANTTTSHHGRIGVHPQQHPSILSSMYKVWIWMCFGGQYFDLNSCPIQLALHDGQSVSPLHSLTSTANSNSSSNSGNHSKNKFNSNMRSIFQSANMKSSSVGVVDHHHHHHRSLSKGNSDSLINRKTPPIHRTYIVQVFVIIPMIIVPLSIAKFVMKSLSSKKISTRGYDDSDDENDAVFTDRQRRKRRGDNSQNHWDDNDHVNSKNSESDLSENDSDTYTKIRMRIQYQINAHLDVAWKYTPPAQAVAYFFILGMMGYIGFQFYTHCNNSLSGDTSTFKGNKQFVYENYAKYNNPGMNGFQPYAQNLYPGGPSSDRNFGSQATILNAELMVQRFEMKQRQMGSDIGGNSILYHSINFLVNKIFQIGAQIEIRDWKSTFYSPWGMAYLMSLWGVLSSLLLFGRVMLPLPDLASRGRESVGKGANKSFRQKKREKIWSERYMSITTGNRFNLYLKIILVRIVENIIVCAIIPQSSFMCKATGHCNIEPIISEIGDPTLIHSRVIGLDHNSMFHNLIYDHLVANLVLISILVTSALMLLGQVLVLDRSSLSLEAHNYIQWSKTPDLLHKRGNGGKKFSSINNESHKIWNDNPRVDSNKNFVGNMKHAVYECFSLEIGALSTSQIFLYIFYAYTAQALVVMMYAIFNCSTGKDWFPLVLALMAIFTAAGGTDVDTANFDELDEIAREINLVN